MYTLSSCCIYLPTFNNSRIFLELNDIPDPDKFLMSCCDVIVANFTFGRYNEFPTSFSCILLMVCLLTTYCLYNGKIKTFVEDQVNQMK